MIRVDHLSKAFESRLALDGLSLTIEPGEILGLVGPNGAGKTTALRCIAGILPPTGGTVSIGNFDIVTQPIEAKKRLALIPDEPHLFGSLTVWEHLEFTAKVYNVPGHGTRGERILAEFELLERKNDVADELSRGMRQKVAIACALLHDPKAILLDEPLTGLDPKAIRNLYATLNQRAAGNVAILLSSHLLSQIEKLCTKFLILREGCRVAYGSMDEIRSKLPALEGDASLEEIFFKATE